MNNGFVYSAAEYTVHGLGPRHNISVAVYKEGGGEVGRSYVGTWGHYVWSGSRVLCTGVSEFPRPLTHEALSIELTELAVSLA